MPFKSFFPSYPRICTVYPHRYNQAEGNTESLILKLPHFYGVTVIFLILQLCTNINMQRYGYKFGDCTDSD